VGGLLGGKALTGRFVFDNFMRRLRRRHVDPPAELQTEERSGRTTNNQVGITFIYDDVSGIAAFVHEGRAGGMGSAAISSSLRIRSAGPGGDRDDQTGRGCVSAGCGARNGSVVHDINYRRSLV